MNKRFTSLSFIIGLFFLLLASVLLIGYFVSALLANIINLYTGVIFLVFGLMMMLMTWQSKSSS